jgi:hypothetical protein
MWGALSDKRTGLSFTIAAGPRQCSHSRVQVQWDSRQYFTVPDSRLSFSSPPATLRATVEASDPASTLDVLMTGLQSSLYSLGSDPAENTVPIGIALLYLNFCLRNCCRGNLFTESLPSNDRLLWFRYSGFQTLCHNIKLFDLCSYDGECDGEWTPCR